MSFSEWIDRQINRHFGNYIPTKIMTFSALLVIFSTIGFNTNIYAYYTGLTVENKISFVFIVLVTLLILMFVYLNDKIDQLNMLVSKNNDNVTSEENKTSKSDNKKKE